jgi:HSP90 family molecular chaperone
MDRTEKYQMTSTKFQTTSNAQNSKLKTELFGSFGIGFWNLFVIWDLEIGI